MSQPSTSRAAQLLSELEEIAKRCGIEVRREKLLREVGYHARSGSCRVKDQNLVIIERGLAASDQLEVLAGVLRERDLDHHYLSPAARRLLQEGAS